MRSGTRRTWSADPPLLRPAGTRPRSTLDLAGPKLTFVVHDGVQRRARGPIGSFPHRAATPRSTMHDGGRQPRSHRADAADPAAGRRRVRPHRERRTRVACHRGVVDAKHARTVLVAEEDGWPRPIVAELLSDETYRMVEADSGASVAELAEGHQPEAIVLDPGLPAKPGGRVVRAPCATDATRAIPVILLSGETEEAARQLFNQASVRACRPCRSCWILAPTSSPSSAPSRSRSRPARVPLV